MAKTVFRPNEIKACSGSVMLKLPVNFEPEVEEVEAEPVEVYEGPTVEELRKEAEEYKVQWEAEKQSLLDKAQAEAKEIVAKAEQAAFDEVKRQTDQAQVAKTNAEAEAADVLKKANEEAAAIIAQAQEKKKNS